MKVCRNANLVVSLRSFPLETGVSGMVGKSAARGAGSRFGRGFRGGVRGKRQKMRKIFVQVKKKHDLCTRKNGGGASEGVDPQKSDL